jgi:hypothetical protein
MIPPFLLSDERVERRPYYVGASAMPSSLPYAGPADTFTIGSGQAPGELVEHRESDERILWEPIICIALAAEKNSVME